MNQAEAQILLTVIFLLGSIAFILLDYPQLSIALVGAVAGQGAAVGVHVATNGKPPST